MVTYRVWVKSSAIEAGTVGWGAIIQTPSGDTWEIAEQVPDGEHQTPMRSTLLAVVSALSMLPQPGAVKIYTDVQYVALGFTDCLDRWIRRGWKKRGGKAVAHHDLWQQIVCESARHQLTVDWTPLGAEARRALELVQLSREEGQRIFIRHNADAPPWRGLSASLPDYDQS